MEFKIQNLVIITKDDVKVESFTTIEKARERLYELLNNEDLVIGGPMDICDITDYGDDHYLLNKESYDKSNAIEYNIMESVLTIK